MGQKHIDALRTRATKIVTRAMVDLELAKERAKDLRRQADMLEKEPDSMRTAWKKELEDKAGEYAIEDAPAETLEILTAMEGDTK